MSGRKHPNLVGWWQMENNLLDWSGAGNDGTVGAGSEAYAAGRFGLAWDNDATRFVDCGNDSSMKGVFDITVCAWLWLPESLTGPNDALIADWLTTGDNRSWWVNYSAVGSIHFRVSTDGTNRTGITTAGWETGQWVHFAGTSFSTGEMIVYRNAKEISQSPTSGGSPFSGTGPVCIGGYTTALTRPAARLDDIRIYNAALSESDIQLVYRGQQPARVYA